MIPDVTKLTDDPLWQGLLIWLFYGAEVAVCVAAIALAEKPWMPSWARKSLMVVGFLGVILLVGSCWPEADQS